MGRGMSPSEPSVQCVTCGPTELSSQAEPSHRHRQIQTRAKLSPNGGQRGASTPLDVLAHGVTVGHRLDVPTHRPTRKCDSSIGYVSWHEAPDTHVHHVNVAVAAGCCRPAIALAAVALASGSAAALAAAFAALCRRLTLPPPFSAALAAAFCRRLLSCRCPCRRPLPTAPPSRSALAFPKRPSALADALAAALAAAFCRRPFQPAFAAGF